MGRKALRKYALSDLSLVFSRTLTSMRYLSGNPTSKIGLCQEGKSAPDALRRSACTKLFLILRRVCWPLGPRSPSFMKGVSPSFAGGPCAYEECCTLSTSYFDAGAK
jgi:hypothetical protein